MIRLAKWLTSLHKLMDERRRRKEEERELNERIREAFAAAFAERRRRPIIDE